MLYLARREPAVWRSVTVNSMNAFPRRHWLFRVLPRYGGEGVIRPPRVWPLIELELCDKDERVGLHERKRMVPNFKVSGQLMTSEVRSNTRRRPSEMPIFGMLLSRP